MAAAVCALRPRRTAAARAQQAQEPADSPSDRDGDRRLPRQRRARPGQPPDDRGVRPKALLGDPERALELARVREDPADVLVVLRLLVVGGTHRDRVAAAGEATQGDADETRAVRERTLVPVDVCDKGRRVDAGAGVRDTELEGASAHAEHADRGW